MKTNGILLEYYNTVDIETTVNALLKLKNNLTKKAITTIVNDNLRQDFFEHEPDVDQIYSLLKLSKNEINKRIMQNLLLSEFQGEIQNVNTAESSFINLQIKKTLVELNIRNNTIVDLSNPINLAQEAVYIDDILLLDRLNSRTYNEDIPHRKSLRKKILRDRFTKKNTSISITEKSINELAVEEKLKNIYDELNKITPGNLVSRGMGNIFYSSDTNKKELPIVNMSTGFKIFLIIKTLLMNGCSN